jgi:exodeoxyribonuclease VII large subunit
VQQFARFFIVCRNYIYCYLKSFSMYQPSLFEATPRIWTIRAINTYIRQKFEADINLQDVWLEGEISNWKRAASRHIYFTMKDSGASIRCVIWRSQASQLLYMPQGEGEAVLAHGKISVYEVAGTYQFYVDDLEPAGQGALHTQFERIKARLDAEGLFDSELKRPLPQFPRQIGVVTSPNAAALRDVLNVLRRRYPVAQVFLAPTQVQGETAPAQIIAALSTVTQRQVDVIILTRGGGSLEDLWAFNDESLARAIAACPVPVVTGVGHEIDFTIADFVADVRAPTPSAAAELVSPDKLELKQKLSDYQFILVDHTQQLVTKARTNLRHLEWALKRLSPQVYIDNYRQRIDTLVSNAHKTLQHQIAMQRQQVENLASQLATINPRATLTRGYAIVKKGQSVVSQTDQVSQGDPITIEVSNGEFGAKVSGD